MYMAGFGTSKTAGVSPCVHFQGRLVLAITYQYIRRRKIIITLIIEVSQYFPLRGGLHFSLLVQRKVERKERTSRRKLGRLVYICLFQPASNSAPREGKKLPGILQTNCFQDGETETTCESRG